MTDDTDLGRPPRHERPRKMNADARPLGDVVLPTRGDGERKRVRGKRLCDDCGEEEIRVDVTAPTDSLAYRYAAHQLVYPVCGACLEQRERLLEAHDAERDRLEQLRVRLRASGIPRRWRSARWADVEVDPGREEVVEAARGWASGRRRRGILLHGEVGRGKTFLAAAAAVHRLALGHVRWLTIPDLMMDLRMPFAAPEYVAAQRALTPRFRTALVLDDLDKVRPNEMQLQPVYVAVNGWIESDLPLLVTMNRDLDGLAAWFGETFGDAIASRLAGHCDVYELSGRDRRLQP